MTTERQPMTDEPMGPRLRSWLAATEAVPEDVGHSSSLVMERVAGAGQRSRWWPLPAFALPTFERPPAAGSSAFAALRFVTAGLFVGIVGGFLLSGVLAPQPDLEMVPAAASDSIVPVTTVAVEPEASPAPAVSPEVRVSPEPVVALEAVMTESPFEASAPTMRKDILRGVRLTVSEVEPGVLHVLRDGVRKLSPFRGWALTAGLDGSLWGTRDWRFFEVGGNVFRPPADREYQPSIVAPDGTLWDWHEGEIVSFDGRRWKVHRRAEGDAMDVGLDGSVWATLPHPKQPRQHYLTRLGERGWVRSDVRVPRGSWPLFVNSKDEIWALLRLASEDASVLHRLVDGEWQRLGPPVAAVDVGDDDTVWLLREPQVRYRDGVEDPTWEDILTDAEGHWIMDFEDVLMRLDAEGWSEWGPADGVPHGLHTLRAAPDGSLWVSAGQETCDGLFHFDGTTWQRYLDGLCIDQYVVSPNGALWVLAGRGGGLDEDNWYDLYVITP